LIKTKLDIHLFTVIIPIMKFSITKKIDKVYVARFDKLYDLCMTFVRIQEYYESPKYKNKYFSLEEFIDYWSNNFGDGSFNYTIVWTGFNVPGQVIKNWIDAFEVKGDRREKEEALIGRFEKRLKKDNVDLKDCYLIGVSKEEKGINEIIEHETAHALYSLYPKYKKSCDAIFKKLNRKAEDIKQIDKAKKKLIKMGYCEDVLLDEIQAYWSTSDSTEGVLSGQDIFKENLKNFLESIA